MRPGDHAEDFFPISSHLLLALWLLRLAHQQPQIYSDDRFGILRTQLSSGHADIDRMQRAGHRWAGLRRTARSQLVGYYLAAVWAG